MKNYLVLAFLSVSLNLTSQNGVMIRGTITDSLGTGIPYASIIERQHRLGVLTDSEGRYRLFVADSLMSSSVTISCIGYESNTVSVTAFVAHQDSGFSLVARPYLLNEMAVTSPKTKYCAQRRGSLAKRSRGSFLFQSGAEICTFIPATDADSEAIIGSVRYFISKVGFPTAPFRITLYAVDSITKGPGVSLLNSDTIVHGSKGGAWLETDLRVFNIPVPTNGFFVGMQWLPDAQVYTEQFGEHLAKANGQSIGGRHDNSQNCWFRTLTLEWAPLDFSGDFNPMIGATISSECPDK